MVLAIVQRHRKPLIEYAYTGERKRIERSIRYGVNMFFYPFSLLFFLLCLFDEGNWRRRDFWSILFFRESSFLEAFSSSPRSCLEELIERIVSIKRKSLINWVIFVMNSCFFSPLFFFSGGTFWFRLNRVLERKSVNNENLHLLSQYLSRSIIYRWKKNNVLSESRDANNTIILL